jgi:hypothetical protein
MLKYQCNECGNTKDLSKATLEVVGGKVRTREAQCECGEFGGFPNIKRTEPSLSNRKDKLWSGVKDRFK